MLGDSLLDLLADGNSLRRGGIAFVCRSASDDDGGVASMVAASDAVAGVLSVSP